MRHATSAVSAATAALRSGTATRAGWIGKGAVCEQREAGRVGWGGVGWGGVGWGVGHLEEAEPAPTEEVHIGCEACVDGAREGVDLLWCRGAHLAERLLALAYLELRVRARAELVLGAGFNDVCSARSRDQCSPHSLVVHLVLLDPLLFSLVDDMVACVPHLLLSACRAPESVDALAASHEFAELAGREEAGGVVIERPPQRLESSLGHLGRAHALNGSRRHESAKIDSQLALKIKPTPEAYSTLAKSLFYMKDYEGSIVAFGQCKQLLPPGETLSMFDRAYLQKAEAAMQNELKHGKNQSTMSSSQSVSSSRTTSRLGSSAPIPKLKPPKFVSREEVGIFVVNDMNYCVDIVRVIGCYICMSIDLCFGVWFSNMHLFVF